MVKDARDIALHYTFTWPWGYGIILAFASASAKYSTQWIVVGVAHAACLKTLPKEVS